MTPLVFGAPDAHTKNMDGYSLAKYIRTDVLNALTYIWLIFDIWINFLKLLLLRYLKLNSNSKLYRFIDKGKHLMRLRKIRWQFKCFFVRVIYEVPAG